MTKSRECDETYLMKYVVTEVIDQILIVTINRPEVLNALNPAAHRELETVFNDYSADPSLRVAILTGTGTRSFCTGSDVKEKSKKSFTPDSSPKTGFGGLTKRFDLYKPVIAAVNGYAIGGGMEMIFACDIVVASETATFSMPETQIGQAAFSGGIQHLVRNLPYCQAMEILLTGKRLTAKEMLEYRLVNSVVPLEQLMSTAIDYARKIIKGAPLSVEATKACAISAMNQGIEQSTVTYPQALVRMAVSNDTVEGGRAFAEKREPNWTGT